MRAQQAMLEERARRAEEGREHEARRRVQQERLRIAREMHDAVGHQVALISVQGARWATWTALPSGSSTPPSLGLSREISRANELI